MPRPAAPVTMSAFSHDPRAFTTSKRFEAEWPLKTESFLDSVVRNAQLKLTYVLSRRPAGSRPEILVEFSGLDTPVLLAHQGELLLALEHLTTKILNLDPEDHDRVSFEADGFKARREHDLSLSAASAIETVRRTGRPFAFPPMSSRERRILHLAMAAAGLKTQSEGDGGQRHLVAYPLAGSERGQ